MRRLLVTALAAALLAACQSVAPPPADPYAGLLPPGKQVTQAASGFPLPGVKNRSVGIVLTNSTEKQLAFIAKYLQELKTNPMLVYTPEMDELSQPQFLMTSIVNKLKERFGRVETLEDFRSAGRVDYIALVDIAVEFPHDFVHAFGYQVRVDILTNRLERVGSLTGQGRESYYCVGALCAVPYLFKAMRTTIDQFNAAADAALR